MGDEYQPLTERAPLDPQHASDRSLVEGIASQSVDCFRRIGDEAPGSQNVCGEASAKWCQRAGGSGLEPFPKAGVLGTHLLGVSLSLGGEPCREIAI